MLCIRVTSHGSVSVCLSVCPSVCPSATSQCSTKTAKRRITQTSPHDSPGNSSLLTPKISAKFDRGHPLRGRRMRLGLVKIGDFWPITGYISKTVKDRHIVSIKSNRKSYALYRMVALPMTLIECPLTTPFSAFCTAIHSFVTGEPGDFKFGTLTYHNTSHPAEKKSCLKGAWSGSNNPF